MEPIDLAGFTLYPYGLGVAVSVAVALIWSDRLAKKAGIRPGTVSLFALCAVPLAFISARLGYVLSEFEYFLSDGFLSFLHGLVDFTSGGYMLYGALAGTVLAARLVSRRREVPFGKLIDVLAAPTALAVALGRLAEGLAGAGYGWGLEDWFAEGEGYSVFVLDDAAFFCRFPFAVSDYYGEWKWAVFILMAVIMGILCVAVCRAGVARDGGRFILFLFSFAAIQILGESLRQDAVLKWGFVRVNQILSAVILLGLLFFLWRKGPRRGRDLILSLLSVLVCLLLVTAMEFAMEGKIAFIEGMPMDLSYLVVALACAGLIVTLLPLWKSVYGKKEDLV